MGTEVNESTGDAGTERENSINCIGDGTLTASSFQWFKLNSERIERKNSIHCPFGLKMDNPINEFGK